MKSVVRIVSMVSTPRHAARTREARHRTADVAPGLYSGAGRVISVVRRSGRRCDVRVRIVGLLVLSACISGCFVPTFYRLPAISGTAVRSEVRVAGARIALVDTAEKEDCSTSKRAAVTDEQGEFRFEEGDLQHFRILFLPGDPAPRWRLCYQNRKLFVPHEATSIVCDLDADNCHVATFDQRTRVPTGEAVESSR